MSKKNSRKTKLPAPAPPSDLRGCFFAGGLITVAALLAYSNSFCGAFIYDDDQAVIRNETIRHLWPIWDPLLPPARLTVGGRPILNLSFALNYAISGMNVWSYHVYNLIIHILAGLSLFGVVRRTLWQPGLRARFGAGSLPLAAAVALLWTLDPLQTESVSYISQRAEAMMGLFYLLTLYGFIRFTEPGVKWPGWPVFCVVSCLFAMMTKEIAVTAPFMVLAYDRTFVAGTFFEALRRRSWLYISLVATTLALTYSYKGIEHRAVGFDHGVSPWTYALTECPAILHYLKLMVWPHPLIIDYGMDMVTDPMQVLPQVAIVLALLALTAVAIFRWPLWGFVGTWFFLILAPTSSFIPIIVSPMGEHRLYLPVAASLMLLVLGLHTWIGTRARFAIAALALLFGALTFQRNEDYRTAFSLWKATVEQSPDNARALNNYGVTLLDAGKSNEAVEKFEKAVHLNPAYADAHYNLGNAHLKLGHLMDAIDQFQLALQFNPDYVGAHNNWANALCQSGKFPEALEQYEAAARIDPNDALVRYNWAHTLLHMNNYAEAKVQYLEALRINPNSADAHNGLGIVLFHEGAQKEAIEEFQEALRLNPNLTPARNNLSKLGVSKN